MGHTRQRVTALVLVLEGLGLGLLVAALVLAFLGDWLLALGVALFGVLWLGVMVAIMREFLGYHTPWWLRLGRQWRRWRLWRRLRRKR